FNFGGRVHTNGNLFLAKGDGSNLYLGDKVTAYGVIVRKKLANGHPITTAYNGQVRILTEAGGCSTTAKKDNDTYCRPLGSDEGSVTDTWGWGATPSWKANIPDGKYHGNLKASPEVKKLNLPLASGNAQPIDLIRRPAVGEKSSAADVYSQRYYQYASLR